MANTLKLCVLCLCAAWLSACQTTPQYTQSTNWQVGDTYSHSFKLTRFDVPLPAGDWLLASVDVYGNSSGLENEEAILLQTNGNDVSDLLILRASRPGVSLRYDGWNPSRHCEKESLFHEKKIANYKYEQNCWYVQGIKLPAIDNLKSWFGEDTPKFIEQHNLNLVPATIYTHHHFADRYHFLDIGQYKTLEAERNQNGAIFPESVQWLTSREAQAPEIARSSMERIIERGQRTHQQYETLFSGS